MKVIEGHEGVQLSLTSLLHRRAQPWSDDCDTLMTPLERPRRRDAEKQGLNAATRGNIRSRDAGRNVLFCGSPSSWGDARRRIVASVVRARDDFPSAFFVGFRS